jgi:hypothetical protein
MISSRPKGSDRLWADPDFFTIVSLGRGVIRQEREVTQSPSLSAVVMNEWSCTYTPIVCTAQSHTTSLRVFIPVHLFSSLY